MRIQYTTIRINVTGNAALDGSTLFAGTPESGVQDPVTGVISYSVVGPIGVFDLAQIIGDFNHPLLMQGLSVENTVNPHVEGSNVNVISPPVQDNPATRKEDFAFALGKTNGLLPNANYLVPVDHRIAIDTSADGGSPGPHTIQMSIARATPEVLNALQAIPVNNLRPPTVWVKPVDVVETSAVVLATIAPGTVIDGMALAAGDEFLLTNQAAGAENGVYVCQDTAPPVRRSDMSSGSEINTGIMVSVKEGATLGQTAYYLNTPNPIIVDTTSQSYRIFGGNTFSRTAARTFVDGDLAANVLTFNHGLGVQHVTYAIYDNNGDSVELVSGRVTATDGNNLDADFTGLTPLAGTWTIRVVG